MKRFAPALFALAFPAVGALAACDDSNGTTKTVTYSGALVNGVDQSPIAGAKICFTSLDVPCVTTAADGTYSIDLPVKTKVEVEVTADGFLSVRSNFVTRDSAAQISAQMFQPAAIKAAFDLAQVPYDEAKGGLLVRVYDPAKGQLIGLAGVKITIEPADGHGPYYLDGLTLSPDAQVTTSVGNALFSVLEDKTYKIKFESDANDCVGTYLWHASDGRAEAVVKPGFATYIYADCPAK